MPIVALLALGLAAWAVLPLPLAVAVGRAFACGATEPGAAEVEQIVGELFWG
ncbi:hypothetical protein [Nocardioides sp. GY 10127]|uniref:hypothetical protein n=1 Tax=Nocardioides sp. GY 10127 TaxID=2569762 RepID=UPI0014580F52|nr:hypothetical protein [Nocardioides sp. GY 10127]